MAVVTLEPAGALVYSTRVSQGFVHPAIFKRTLGHRATREKENRRTSRNRSVPLFYAPFVAEAVEKNKKKRNDGAVALERSCPAASLVFGAETAANDESPYAASDPARGAMPRVAGPTIG
jgi:hypothetical protein